MKREKRLRDMTWDDYGISKYRYQELKAFCMQYNEKKAKIHYGLQASHDGAYTKSNSIGKPTEQQAIENEAALQDVRMIEKAAVMTNPAVWKYILRSVTGDLSYELVMYDEKLGRIPMGKTEFYANRRLFYHFLDAMKLGTN